ncbi:MAG: hypothetical protein HYT72_02085 [Candidatus Aenigmarchaeota archaeon]|nr:hypothetical protein [Candidatus Aenigmarchaeota archaeon]
MGIEKVVVYVVILLVCTYIAVIFITSVLIPKKVEAGNTTKIVDRVTGSLWFSNEPEIVVRSKKINGEFEYSVDASIGMRFDGKTAEEITAFPVVSFKGAKNRDDKATDITIKKGETKYTALNFKLRSMERPMIINDKSTEFRCGSDLSKCLVYDKQKLLLKDFFFSFSAFQIVPKIGPCVLVSEIQCPGEKRVVNLKLDDEKEPCNSQEEKKNCAKTEKMCGTLANIQLVKIETDESLLERILPGSPSCGDKAFAVDISVGSVDKNIFAGKFGWKIGEDITFGFWEKTDKKDPENCWRDGGEGCADLYLGEKVVTIPVESYK